MWEKYNELNVVAKIIIAFLCISLAFAFLPIFALATLLYLFHKNISGKVKYIVNAMVIIVALITIPSWYQNISPRESDATTISPTVQHSEEMIPVSKKITVTVSPTITKSPTSTSTPTNTLIPTKIYIQPTSTDIPTARPTVVENSINETSGFVCNCSKTCGEMSSCEEAQYQLNNCGCSRRDGDDDGIACDNQCQ